MLDQSHGTDKSLQTCCYVHTCHYKQTCHYIRTGRYIQTCHYIQTNGALPLSQLSSFLHHIALPSELLQGDGFDVSRQQLLIGQMCYVRRGLGFYLFIYFTFSSF